MTNSIVSGGLQGEISFCICHSIGDEGHTFECVLQQFRKRRVQERLVSEMAPLQEQAEQEGWDE